MSELRKSPSPYSRKRKQCSGWQDDPDHENRTRKTPSPPPTKSTSQIPMLPAVFHSYPTRSRRKNPAPALDPAQVEKSNRYMEKQRRIAERSAAMDGALEKASKPLNLFIDVTSVAYHQSEHFEEAKVDALVEWCEDRKNEIQIEMVASVGDRGCASLNRAEKIGLSVVYLKRHEREDLEAYQRAVRANGLLVSNSSFRYLLKSRTVDEHELLRRRIQFEFVHYFSKEPTYDFLVDFHTIEQMGRDPSL